ncbi:MAG: DUF3153 domain-containing protein [Bacillota bacterium]
MQSKLRLKHLIFATLLMLLATVLTGCVVMDYQVTVNDDGTGQIRTKMLVDEGLLALAGEWSGVEDLRKDAEQNGFTTTPIVEREMPGFIAVSKTMPLEDLPWHEALTGVNGATPVHVQKGWFRTTYQLDALFDLSDFDNSDGDEMVQAIMDEMDMKFRITLPGEIQNHNATTTENGALVWKLEPGTKSSLHAAAAAWRWGNIAVTALVLLALAGGGVYYATVHPGGGGRPSLRILFAGAGLVILAFAVYWGYAYNRTGRLYSDGEAALARHDWATALNRFEAGNRAAPVFVVTVDAKAKVATARRAKTEVDLARVKEAVAARDFKLARTVIDQMPAEEGGMVNQAERVYEQGAAALTADGERLLSQGEFEKVADLLNQAPKDAKSVAELNQAYQGLAPATVDVSDMLPRGAKEEERRFIRFMPSAPPMLAVSWKRSSGSNLSFFSYDGAVPEWYLEGDSFSKDCRSTGTLEGSLIPGQKSLVVYGVCEGASVSTYVRIIGREADGELTISDTNYPGSAEVKLDGASVVVNGSRQAVISWNGTKWVEKTTGAVAQAPAKTPVDPPAETPREPVRITYQTFAGGKVTAPAEVTVKVGDEVHFVRNGPAIPLAVYIVSGYSLHRQWSFNYDEPKYLAMSPGTTMIVIHPDSMSGSGSTVKPGSVYGSGSPTSASGQIQVKVVVLP